MDPVVQVLSQYGAVGVLALVAVLVAKRLFDRLAEAQDAEVQRLEQERDRVIVQAEQEKALLRAERDLARSELGKLNETVQHVYLDQIGRSTAAVNDATQAVAVALAAVRRS